MKAPANAALGSVGIAILAPGVFAAPQIAFEKTQFDLGEVKVGESVKAVFRFRNTGDPGLRITRVQQSCGCALARALTTNPSPDESSEVEVVFQGRRWKRTYREARRILSREGRRGSLGAAARRLQ